MRTGIDIIDKGIIGYGEAWEEQKKHFERLVRTQRSEGNNEPQVLLYCEHPHVYTIGKSGKETNLLIPEEQLKKIGATYWHTDRGGDITYHGYGQLVGYPILDLQRYGIGLKEYIHTLEECVIKTVAEFGIKGERLEGATGVWVKGPKTGAREMGVETSGNGAKNGERITPKTMQGTGLTAERKICAIGVKASRYVTMHGFALNVNTDLSYFGYINPCGFTAKGVTSIAEECERNVEMEAVKQLFGRYFLSAFE